ncbi:MAG: hypothetical protein ABIC82_05530 [bacterium]
MRRVYYGGTRKDYKKRNRKYKKRDWHRSEFNNPFFGKPKTLNLKPYLYFLLFSAIIVASSYFFLVFDYWKINSVTIETQNQAYRDKVQDIIDDALNSKVLKVLNGSNYFLFNPQIIKEKIENELLVKNLEIQKKIPNKIIVNFSEINPSYIWIQGGKFYNVDENDVVLDEIISVQKQITDDANAAEDEIKNEFDLEKIKKFLQNSDADLKLPIIYNESDGAIKSREFIDNKEVFQTISDLNLKITQKVGVSIILYKINTDNFKNIEVITEHGWKIFFNPDADLVQQCENLYSLMEKTFKETEPSEYIDLRYGNKVYYK